MLSGLDVRRRPYAEQQQEAARSFSQLLSLSLSLYVLPLPAPVQFRYGEKHPRFTHGVGKIKFTVFYFKNFWFVSYDVFFFALL
jgi:hypothetical protein